jgi:hypothetical protein
MAFINKIKNLANILASISHGGDTLTKGHCDVLLVRHDVDCGYIYKKQAYAHILDSFGELLNQEGLKTRTIATPYSLLVKDKAYNSPRTYNRHELKTRAVSFFAKRLGLNYLTSTWKETQDEQNWIKILNTTKPKIIVAIQPDSSICKVGNLFNIPVYDFQHGVIASENPWYGKKYRENEDSNKLPDGYLCWDDESAQVIEAWASDKTDIKVVGNPWFSRFISHKATDKLVNAALNEKVFINNKPTLLVSLSWGMDQFYTDPSFNKVMINELESLILNTAHKYNWLIRLHPVQLRGSEKGIVHEYLARTFGRLTDSVNWTLASNLPLPIILGQTQLHITDFSTVVTEAAWFGIPTALLSPELQLNGMYSSYFALERKLGLAQVLPHCSSALSSWIETHKSCCGEVRTYQDRTNELTAFVKSIAK